MKVAFLTPPQLGVTVEGYYVFTNDDRRVGPMTAAQAAAYLKMLMARFDPLELDEDAVDEFAVEQGSAPSP